MSAVTQPGIVWFIVPSEPGDPGPHFAIRRGRDYWSANRYRGLRLCGVHNRRAGAALVGGSGDPAIRVRLVTP